MDWNRDVSLEYLEKSLLDINEKMQDLYNHCFVPINTEDFDNNMEFFLKTTYEKFENKKNQDKKHVV